MIVGVGVRQHRLRLRRFQHLLQVGIEKTRRQSVALRKLCRELTVGFGNAHNLKVSPVLKLVEESRCVAVHQARKRHAQRRFFFRRGVRLSAGINGPKEQ